MRHSGSYSASRAPLALKDPEQNGLNPSPVAVRQGLAQAEEPDLYWVNVRPINVGHPRALEDIVTGQANANPRERDTKAHLDASIAITRTVKALCGTGEVTVTLIFPDCTETRDAEVQPGWIIEVDWVIAGRMPPFCATAASRYKANTQSLMRPLRSSTTGSEALQNF